MNYMEAGNGRPSIVVDLTAFPYDCFVPAADVARYVSYDTKCLRKIFSNSEKITVTLFGVIV